MSLSPEVQSALWVRSQFGAASAAGRIMEFISVNDREGHGEIGMAGREIVALMFATAEGVLTQVLDRTEFDAHQVLTIELNGILDLTRHQDGVRAARLHKHLIESGIRL